MRMRALIERIFVRAKAPEPEKPAVPPPAPDAASEPNLFSRHVVVEPRRSEFDDDAHDRWFHRLR